MVKKDLNKQKREDKYKKEVNVEESYQKFFGGILLILGILILISALPRQVSFVVDLWFIKLNIGTQLDFIRLIIGIGLGYIGYRGIQSRWQI